MPKHIAQQLLRYRKRLKVTQDQLASEYGVSGPAVFKFEKGYVLPSLKLWVPMAKAMGIGRRQAVLMHVKDKLPEQYKAFIQIDGGSVQKGTSFSKYKTEKKLREAMLKDKSLPSGLTDLGKSNPLWALYKPTGAEIDLLRDIFSKLGEGTARDFVDGLRLVREFKGKKC